MKSCIVLLLAMLFLMPDSPAQTKSKAPEKNKVALNDKIYNALPWRNIGPFRGGRSAAVTGVPGKPNLYYFGSTGGGVWRTSDAGNTWENISDGFFGGSLGAVAVSEWDNNVIYAGGGEVTVRGNVSSGYGMWRSTDAGKTWKFAGLKDSKHIPRIRIHPKNPDLVYAAVLGDLYKSSEERGVFRSNDGGTTWKRILFANADAGAVDLAMDPNNSRVLFASTWRIRRTPYSLESGGEGSALWKSTDGGDTWENLSKKEGLPKGTLGIIGVSVSPVNSNRIYAIIENEHGGIFRSDDGGNTWQKTNEDRNLRQRAWYYSRIYADTKEEDIVYVMNVEYHKSKDGGKSFQAMEANHGDHHDLWIAPEDNQRMIIGDDGGGQVSFDAGKNWSTYENQPTAQFYRVITDNHFPYRIYGAQQDNSTVRILHRTDGNAISAQDWQQTAGGESGHLAVDPLDEDVVYGGSYDGYLTRRNHRTGEQRSVNVWPDNPMGHGAEGAKFRFQWNFPIFFSPHDPKKLFAASQHLHVTVNGGETWKTISPDLTRNDPSKLGPSGGPITKDNTGVEYYCTIFAVGESPYEKDLIVAGSDDGVLSMTRDGGTNWTTITPSGMPAWTMINSVEFDPFEKGGIYIAATAYKSGDYKPYLFKTHDYGKTWTKITEGIDVAHFTRVLRADPKRKGLLYAGTESGLYISFDDGATWKNFQSNLPVVPITDLTIKNDNLIAATQGRSFWIIDDLTPLYQLSEQVSSKTFHLFAPTPAYRMNGGQSKTISKVHGRNHPGGVPLHFFLKDTISATAVLEIMDAQKQVIKTFKSKPDKKKKEELLPLQPGLNTFVWNMRYADAESFEGMILWAGSVAGPRAMPGLYKAKLAVNGVVEEVEFEIKKDPRTGSNQEDIRAQFDFLMTVRDKLSETNKTIKRIRTVREQLNRIIEPMKDKAEMKDVVTMADELKSEMKKIEEALYQTKNKSGQDPLNFPVRLNNKLAALSSEADRNDFRPTDQVKAVFAEISGKIDEHLKAFQQLTEQKIPEFNELIRQKKYNALTFIE
jgi:photosystem II stability/assembly factor-like uncharacterized protein